MRLECHVAVARGHKGQGSARVPNPAKAFIVIGNKKIKGVGGVSELGYSIQISTTKERNQGHILISAENVLACHDNFISKGNMTIEFKEPKSIVYISKASEPQLRKFREMIICAIKGEKLQVGPAAQVKTTDFNAGPIKLSAKNRQELIAISSGNFPNTLKQLSINDCQLDQVDTRWFANTKLEELNLAHNNLGLGNATRRLSLISRFRFLTQLNFGHNSFHMLPSEFELPQSLIFVNMEHNNLTKVPSCLFRLKNLRQLNLAHNQINNFPIELALMPTLTILDLSSNRIPFVPYILYRTKRRKKFLILFLSDNLNNNAVGLRHPDITERRVDRLETIAYAACLGYQIPIYKHIRPDVLPLQCLMCGTMAAPGCMSEVQSLIDLSHVAEQYDHTRVQLMARSCLSSDCRQQFIAYKRTVDRYRQ